MFFMLVLLLILSNALFASGQDHAQPKDTDLIKLRFCDDEDEAKRITHTIVNAIGWSRTIKDAVDDLGIQHPLPIHNLHRRTFTYLTKLMTSAETNAVIEYKNKTAYELEVLFLKKALEGVYAGIVAQPPFLIETNYLNLDKNCMSAISSFYARAMHNPTITVRDGTVIFDNLPHDLEPFIAGWLCHDLLKKEKPVRETISSLPASGYRDLVISNASTDGSFAYISQEPHLSYGGKKVHIIDSTTHSIVTQPINSLITLPGAICVLSHDKKYLLLTNHCVLSNKQIIALYDTEKLMSHNPNADSTKETEHKIAAALYDEQTQQFKIIADDKNQNLHFLMIDPTKNLEFQYWDTHPKPPVYHGIELYWSCVHSNLIRVTTTTTKDGSGLIYKDNQLCECTYETDDPFVFKYQINGIHSHTSGDFIQSKAKAHNRYATEIAFIPGLTNIRSTLYAAIGAGTRSLFDPYHLCVNEVRSDKVITHHMFPPKLRKMLQFCSDELHKNNKNILPYAYAAHCYYNYPETWIDRCAPFLTLLPEITKILE